MTTPAHQPPDPPALEYARRLAARRERATRLARREARMKWGKRTLIYTVIMYAIFDEGVTAPLLAALGVVLVPLAAIHEAIVRAWRRAGRAAAYYEAALARVEDRWRGTGHTGTEYRVAGHLYAADLDVFGDGSLFQLLATGQTAPGRDALAGWLLAPANLVAIGERHAAIDELRDDLELRELLATADIDAAHLDSHTLGEWSRPEPILPQGARGVAAGMIAWGLVAVAFAWLLSDDIAWWLVAGLAIIETALSIGLRRRAQVVARHAGVAGNGLGVLRRYARLLGKPTFIAPFVKRSQASLVELRGGAPLAAEAYGLACASPLLLSFLTQLFPALDRRRRAVAGPIDAAIAGLGDFEAILALATYAYEHPGDWFPEIVADGPCFEGIALRHPLMPPSRCVPNDVQLGREPQLMLVSGSNMSGKSTLLRTVGTNAVLALAGAPVRAERLRLSPLTVGAAMRFADSLEEGTSFFLAVLKRMRAILDRAGGAPPLLFLLDEIMPGTNSHDRVVGAEAVLRKLVERGAIGLATTHDLALAAIVDELSPRAANFHCEDQLVDGQMSFDYKLRPGVVTKSNALALMRSVGLEV